jgi:LacI family transcriptional regulator
VRTDLRRDRSTEAAVAELLSRRCRPTALFTGDSEVTQSAYQALSELHVQQQVALVGFDDTQSAALLTQQITVITPDPAAIAGAAAHLLFRRIDGDDSAPAELVVPARLVKRGTGEIQLHQDVSNSGLS